MITKNEKEYIREQFKMVWGANSKMTDYCTNQVLTFTTLPAGNIITIDKQSIKKDFCFGESGYDYDEAQEAAEHARKSVNYFIEENMKYFNHWINDLEDALKGFANSRYALAINPKEYYRQPENCQLSSVVFMYWYEVIDACGGSVTLEEMPGKEITYRGQPVRIATPEEITIILEAYKEAREEHKKRVEKYLKKYGLDHVNTWTYWRDA